MGAAAKRARAREAEYKKNPKSAINWKSKNPIKSQAAMDAYLSQQRQIDQSRKEGRTWTPTSTDKFGLKQMAMGAGSAYAGGGVGVGGGGGGIGAAASAPGPSGPSIGTAMNIQRDPRMDAFNQQIQGRLDKLGEPVDLGDSTARQKNIAYGDIGASAAGARQRSAVEGARRGGLGDIAGRGIDEAAQGRMARAGTTIDIEQQRREDEAERFRQTQIAQTMGLGLQGVTAAGAGERGWANIGLGQRGQDISRELGLRGGDIAMRGQDIGQQQFGERMAADEKDRVMRQWLATMGA